MGARRMTLGSATRFGAARAAGTRALRPRASPLAAAQHSAIGVKRSQSLATVVRKRYNDMMSCSAHLAFTQHAVHGIDLVAATALRLAVEAAQPCVQVKADVYPQHYVSTAQRPAATVRLTVDGLGDFAVIAPGAGIVEPLAVRVPWDAAEGGTAVVDHHKHAAACPPQRDAWVGSRGHKAGGPALRGWCAGSEEGAGRRSHLAAGP